MKISASKNYDYEKLRSDAKRHIDMMADHARSKFTTPGITQAAVYNAKLDQARRFLDMGGEPETYPLLNNEVGITGPSISIVADMIIAKYNSWCRAVGHIEKVRLTRKQMVSAAADDIHVIKALAENTLFEE